MPLFLYKSLELFQQFCAREQTSFPPQDLSFFEEHEVRDGAYGKLLCKLWMLVDVDFKEYNLAS